MGESKRKQKLRPFGDIKDNIQKFYLLKLITYDTAVRAVLRKLKKRLTKFFLSVIMSAKNLPMKKIGGKGENCEKNFLFRCFCNNIICDCFYVGVRVFCGLFRGKTG